MSFSSHVKEELVKQIGKARHCQVAELAAILHFCGKADYRENAIYLQTENDSVMRKCFTILEKAYNIEIDIEAQKLCLNDRNQHILLWKDELEKEKVLQSLKLIGTDGQIKALEAPVDPVLIKGQCCKRAYLKGAFISSGSISNPEKGYHLEFVCNDILQAEQLRDIIKGFEIEAKIIQRKKYQVLYLKEGESIVTLLNVMGAYASLMELENMRILKDMRNSINRRVNCETANIRKTVDAATKQVEDILFLKEHYGIEKLPDGLREIAMVRLENPEATLKEIGEMLDPPVGKSGVNHRLRKISEIADKWRL